MLIVYWSYIAADLRNTLPPAAATTTPNSDVIDPAAAAAESGDDSVNLTLIAGIAVAALIVIAVAVKLASGKRRSRGGKRSSPTQSVMSSFSAQSGNQDSFYEMQGYY